MEPVLVDTGVWIALCDPKDNTFDRKAIQEIYERIIIHQIVVPWPIVYETLRTRLVRNKIAVQQFERLIKSPRIILLDDSPWREDALALSLDSSLRNNRPLSMVDCIIRLLLDDEKTRIRFLFTANEGDFADVCKRRHIELWHYS